MVKGTRAEDVINVLNKLTLACRQKVIEVTLDMASSMNLIVTRCFPNAVKVIDRFDGQKLACEALQEIRRQHRWEAINKETNDIQNAGLDKVEYAPGLLENGDTVKQLFFRSRYLLFNSPDKWSESRKRRAQILFDLYPDLNDAYWLCHRLRVIYNKTQDKKVGYTKLSRWFNDVTNVGNKAFNTISATIYSRYAEILNLFDYRATNANAESFNAKLKAFRAALHGVSDLKVFLYRVTKIYA